MTLFRDLGEAEAASFRKWARENYKPFSEISGLWHPVVQAECTQMNKEADVWRPGERAHTWGADGFCVYCRNVHRTDNNARSTCSDGFKCEGRRP